MLISSSVPRFCASFITLSFPFRAIAGVFDSNLPSNVAQVRSPQLQKHGQEVYTLANPRPRDMFPVRDTFTANNDFGGLHHDSIRNMQTVQYGEIAGSIRITVTKGLGTPVTLETPAPTQTDANNQGSSQCHSIDDACDRAYAQFEDDRVYTQWASYYSRIQSGIIMVATFGQAGCTAQFQCDDYGIGMSGREIKDA